MRTPSSARRRFFAVAAGVTVAMALSVAPIAPANAAPPQQASPPQTAAPSQQQATPKTYSRTVTATRTTTGENGIMAPPPVIVCTITAGYPSKSSFNGGSVHAVGYISCTAPVSALEIDVYLLYTMQIFAHGDNEDEGTSWLSANTGFRCVSGDWLTKAHGWILWPPGYTPGASTVDDESGRSIDCDS